MVVVPVSLPARSTVPAISSVTISKTRSGIKPSLFEDAGRRQSRTPRHLQQRHDILANGAAMELDLEAKRAIVTGASKGIGAAVAQEYAREGARVALIARDEGSLRAVAAACGPATVVMPADLSRADELSRAFAACIDQLGGVDILVNNAGSSPNGSIEQITDEQWEESFQLKLMGYVRGMRAVIPSMRAQRDGRIVNIGGVAGVHASAGYVLAAYNAALVHVTRSTAEHVGPDGITVTTLHPGPTLTDRLRTMLNAAAEARGVSVEEFGQQVVAQGLPLRRLGTPEEIAKMIVFLTSDVARWMTGSGVLVDGGAAKGNVTQ
jgi:NAD(P)-dependent dehydrogenase (short-subunit alcohol dehydrogenase family)